MTLDADSRSRLLKLAALVSGVPCKEYQVGLHQFITSYWWHAMWNIQLAVTQAFCAAHTLADSAAVTLVPEQS